MSDPNVVIVRYGAAQHRVVTRSQLRKRLTNRQIDHALARSLILPVHRGVYQVGNTPLTLEGRALAACWATGGLAAYRMAGALFGLRSVPAGEPEVVVAGGVRRVPGVVVHRARLGPADTTRIGCVPVVSVPLLLLQLAEVMPDRFARALDDCLVRGLTTVPRIEDFLSRAGRGRAAVALLRSEVALRKAGQAPTESILEDELLELTAKVPDIQLARQRAATLVTGRNVRFDLGDAPAMAAFEADGAGNHAGLLDRLADKRRDEEARRSGIVVQRFTAHDIRNEPLRVLGVIRATQLRALRPSAEGPGPEV